MSTVMSGHDIRADPPAGRLNKQRRDQEGLTASLPKVQSVHQQHGHALGASRDGVSGQVPVRFSSWLKDTFSGFKHHVLKGHYRSRGTGTEV